jgi:hypothetical protein
MSGRTIFLAGFGNRIPSGDLTIMFVVHPAGRTNSAISRIRSSEFCYSRIRIVVGAGRRESRYIESCKEIFYTDILRKARQLPESHKPSHNKFLHVFAQSQHEFSRPTV